MDLDLLTALQRGDIPLLCHDPHGRLHSQAPLPRALLCGSFNPLHDGHRQLAAFAAGRLGVPVDFEIGLINADKAPLSFDDLRRRLGQFVGVGPVWLTRAPTFAAKARLFAGVAFVVGADTAERVVAQRFYGDSADGMHRALADIRTAGCRFLVAGRTDASGRFVPADRLQIPDEYRDLFAFVSEADFRLDVSSTGLRAAGPGR
jgi:hypothetical protein